MVLFFKKKVINAMGYRGVEGDNWYLNDRYPETLKKYFDEEIERSWYDTEYVDVCNDAFFFRKYIYLSKREKIEFRILLCETERICPKMDVAFKKNFIGYDYAYPGGSYYSSVLNDICSNRIHEFADIKLNSNGLFERREEIDKFIKLRNEYINKDKGNLLEKGEFIVYKLYDINY